MPLVVVTIHSDDPAAARDVLTLLRDGLTHSRFRGTTDVRTHPNRWHEAPSPGGDETVTDWTVTVELEDGAPL